MGIRHEEGDIRHDGPQPRSTARISPTPISTEPMTNRNLLRGLFLVAISLIFGLGSLRYQTGRFERAGPGLFPLLVSSLLFLLGAVTVVRALLVERAPFNFNVRNIALILGSLCGFALISEYVNMIAGIVFMVFVATFAGTSYSVVRNIKIALGLIAMALFFQKVLGVQLPLY
jgi:hypothetical protein